MKTILMFILLTMNFLAQANENHLLFVPTPVRAMDSQGGEFTIVMVPYVTGFGGEFERYCEAICSPLWANVKSPIIKEDKMDVNPASVAGVMVSVGGKGLLIDYSKAKKEALEDRALLRALVACVRQFAHHFGGEQFQNKGIEIQGVPKESALHLELEECLKEELPNAR